MLQEFVGFYLKQAAKIGNKKPPSMQFVTIEVSSLEGEFDTNSVHAWLEQSELTEQGGRRQLCEVI